MDAALGAAAAECGADEAEVRMAARSVPVAPEMVQVASLCANLLKRCSGFHNCRPVASRMLWRHNEVQPGLLR